MVGFLGYSPEKTFSMGIAQTPHLIPSLVFLFLNFQVALERLKKEKNKAEVALQILLWAVSYVCAVI